MIECPNQLVLCCYADNGCNFYSPRFIISAHENDTNFHVLLLADIIKGLNAKIESLENKNQINMEVIEKSVLHDEVEKRLDIEFDCSRNIVKSVSSTEENMIQNPVNVFGGYLKDDVGKSSVPPSMTIYENTKYFRKLVQFWCPRRKYDTKPS